MYRQAPSSPDPQTALFQSGRTRSALGRVVSDRCRRGLKDAELQKGPTSGTLRPQQAGLGDGSGATPPDTTRIKVGYAHGCATDAIAFQPGKSRRRAGADPAVYEELNGIDVLRWLEAWLEACAKNAGRPPDDLSPWLPWSMNEERRRTFMAAG